MPYVRGQAGQPVGYKMVSRETGFGLSGLIVTVTRSLDGGGELPATGLNIDLGNGHYVFILSVADATADNGTYYFRETSCVPQEKTIPFFPSLSFPLSVGGTGSNLSATGPGVLVQAGVGLPLSVVSVVGLGAGGTGNDLSATGPGIVAQPGVGLPLTVVAHVGLAVGGTGSNLSATGPGVLVQAGGGAAVSVVAPGGAGNVLTSVGGVWTSAAPAGGGNISGIGTTTAIPSFSGPTVLADSPLSVQAANTIRLSTAGSVTAGHGVLFTSLAAGQLALYEDGGGNGLIMAFDDANSRMDLNNTGGTARYSVGGADGVYGAMTDSSVVEGGIITSIGSGASPDLAHHGTGSNLSATGPGVLVQAGAGAVVSVVAPGTAGNVLTSVGGVWASAAPAGGSLAIGAAITGSTASRALYVDAGGNLGNDIGVARLAAGSWQWSNAGGIVSTNTSPGQIACDSGAGVVAYLCAFGTYGGLFQNGGYNVAISFAGYAIDTAHGLIRVPGVAGDTFAWTAGVGAPAPQAVLALPLSAYGAGAIAQVLGTPDIWALVNVGGTNYKLPLYL